jgi:hypothetical protein
VSTDIVRCVDVTPPADVDLTGVQTLAKAMFESGVFPDVKSAAHAGVKIMAGWEIGLAPVEAMRSFHIIKGKVEFAAEFLAQRVRLHPSYDYEVLYLENDGCRIQFLRDGKEIGVSSFDEEDRKRAGLELETTKDGRTSATPWATYPRNMMFARTMSNGVAFFAPDVIAGGGIGARSIIDAALRDELDEPEGSPTTIVQVGDPAANGEDAGVGAQAAPSSPAAAEPKPRKATKAQLSKLVLMAQEFGWSDDERHRRAGVASFTELTKPAAHALIEAWSAEIPERLSGGDSEPAAAEVADTDAGAASPPASGPPPLDPSAPPSEEFKRNVRRQLGRKNEMAPESAILILVRKFYQDVKSIEDVTNGMLGIAFDAFLRRGSCSHPVEHREDGGFCRRCGQQVGAA